MLKFQRIDRKSYRVIWIGEKVAILHYTPQAKFCYRLNWQDGGVNYGCSMDFIEMLIRAVMSRDEKML